MRAGRSWNPSRRGRWRLLIRVQLIRHRPVGVESSCPESQNGILVSEAFPEELAFRGYLFHNLAGVLPLWLAWALTATLFGALHILSSSGANSLEQQLLYVVMAIGFGLLTTSARVATGALWMSMGIHTSIDFLLIAPGGATLPVEPTTPDLYGGVLVVTAACLTATSLVILFWHRRGGQRPDAAAKPVPSI